MRHSEHDPDPEEQLAEYLTLLTMLGITLLLALALAVCFWHAV